MRERDKILKESFDYISNNFNTRFDEIPRHLVNAWFFDPKEDDEEQYQFAWTVFTYVLMVSKRMQGIFEFSETEERLAKLFSNWQVCLALAEINAVTEIEIKAFNIFDVEKLENVIVEISTK